MSYKVSPFETPPLIRPPTAPRPNTSGSSRSVRGLGDTTNSAASQSATAARLGLPVRLGLGTRGVQERGDTNFLTRDESTAKAFEEWHLKKRKEAQERALRQRQEEAVLRQQLAALAYARGIDVAADSPSSSPKKNGRGGGDGDGEDQHGSILEPGSPRALTSARRARERELWRHARYQRDVRAMQSAEDAQHERAELRMQLGQNEADRKKYVEIVASDRVVEERRQRKEMADKLATERAAAHTINAHFAAAPCLEEVDPHDVVERMHRERVEEALRLRPETRIEAERRREERRKDESIVASRKQSETLANRIKHDTVVVDELTSARTRLVAKTAKLSMLYDETHAEAMHRQAVADSVRESNKERVDNLKMARKEAEAHRHDAVLQRHAWIARTHDEVLRERENAMRVKRAKEEAAEQLRQSILALRGEDVGCPRRAKQMQCEERTSMVKYMREQMELRKAEFAAEAEAELAERRRAYELKKQEHSLSRPQTANSSRTRSVASTPQFRRRADGSTKRVSRETTMSESQQQHQQQAPSSAWWNRG